MINRIQVLVLLILCLSYLLLYGESGISCSTCNSILIGLMNKTR